jgi:hypothetical protein
LLMFALGFGVGVGLPLGIDVIADRTAAGEQVRPGVIADRDGRERSVQRAGRLAGVRDPDRNLEAPALVVAGGATNTSWLVKPQTPSTTNVGERIHNLQQV